MTIDPMAAVTTATDSVARSAATADPAASANATVSPQNATQPSAVDQQGTKIDLFDYTAKHQYAPPAIDTLAPDAKAKYLANPAELGGKVLEKMESFHQRSQDFHNDFQNGAWGRSQPMAAAGGDVMGGPAQQHVAGTAGQGPDMLDGLRRVMDYAIETTMVTTSSSQFTKTINTLMKGQ